jgi:hypothetical protein
VYIFKKIRKNIVDDIEKKKSPNPEEKSLKDKSFKRQICALTVNDRHFITKHGFVCRIPPQSLRLGGKEWS